MSPVSYEATDGYTRILLGLRVSDGRTFTLSRAVGGDTIEVFNQAWSGVPLPPDPDAAGGHGQRA